MAKPTIRRPHFLTTRCESLIFWRWEQRARARIRCSLLRVDHIETIIVLIAPTSFAGTNLVTQQIYYSSNYPVSYYYDANSLQYIAVYFANPMNLRNWQSSKN